MSEKEFLEQIERQHHHALSAEQNEALESFIAGNPVWKEKANEHRAFLHHLADYGSRRKFSAGLEEIHHDLTMADELPRPRGIRVMFSRNKMSLAIAASVALISVAATLLVAHGWQMNDAAEYHELKRNVEQIKKSQSQLMADFAKTKKKAPQTGKYAGTGFVIASNGYVATSYHLVKDADSVYIENESAGMLKTSVIFSDATNDISILKIESDWKPSRSVPAIISPNEAQLGENVFTLGYPREDIVFGHGFVSASSGYHQNPNAYQISVPVNPGNSGGPLLDSKGDVIGLISGVQTETAGAAFAIKGSVLLNVLNEIPSDSLHAAPKLARSNSLRNLSQVEQVKRLKEFVFMVRVYK